VLSGKDWNQQIKSSA